MSAEKEVTTTKSSVLEYVNAAASASDRARIVMIVMVTISVLVFVGFWNNLGGVSWMDGRIDIRRDALRLFKDKQGKSYDPETDSSLTLEDKERYQKARQYIRSSRFDINSEDDRNQLLEEIMALRKIRIERIRLIEIPFFGGVFDSNDMGIFASIAFIVVYLLFRYSISRELSNYSLTFRVAEKAGELRSCYELLAMQQVLSMPAVNGEKQSRVWIGISKLLFVIPLAVQVVQLRLNWITRANGYLLNTKHWNVVLISNALGVLITTILTCQCLLLSRRIDQVWRTFASKVYQSKDR